MAKRYNITQGDSHNSDYSGKNDTAILSTPWDSQDSSKETNKHYFTSEGSQMSKDSGKNDTHILSKP